MMEKDQGLDKVHIDVSLDQSSIRQAQAGFQRSDISS
jgi:hypothetical protein